MNVVFPVHFKISAKGFVDARKTCVAKFDTDSQANLVRRDIAGKLLLPSRCPERIVQANGDPVGGGAKEVELGVTFREKVHPNDDEELVWRVTGLFRMEDEMIFGYP